MWARFKFPAAVAVGLLGFLQVALPFAVRPAALGVNHVEHSARLASSGMPTHAQMSAIAQAGFGVVVNLAPDEALGSFDNEAGVVERLGMRYFHVPIDFTSPQPVDYTRFARAMREAGDERVLVHCQLSLRASSLMFLYRTIELGEDVDRAYDDVARVWQPTPA
jgi:uncharacterized protein (TIGR01244 family)